MQKHNTAKGNLKKKKKIIQQTVPAPPLFILRYDLSSNISSRYTQHRHSLRAIYCFVFFVMVRKMVEFALCGKLM